MNKGNIRHTGRTIYVTTLRYQDVYPGIDLVYYGNQGQLEYDFIVAPEVDPTSAVLRGSMAVPSRWTWTAVRGV